MKTILVVDDEKDNRETVKTILEKQGYKVIMAVNGNDCLKKLKTTKPDLILLDILMPGMFIRDVVKKIKDTKIIFVSSVLTSEAEKEELTKQKNIIGFIQKPFNMKDIINSIKKALGE